MNFGLRGLWRGGLASAIFACFFWSCSVYDESLVADSSSSSKSSGHGGDGAHGDGGNGGGGGTTSSSMGGAPPTNCTTPADCGADTECVVHGCDQGLCTSIPTADGTPLAEQTAGDCLETQCDGAGGIKQAPDDFDVPDDRKECTVDECSGGVVAHTPKASGEDCTENGGAHCNDASECVECVDDADCPSNVCDTTFHCASAQCGDDNKNGTETDVDCGGGMCPKCGPLKDCFNSTDCIGRSCSIDTLTCTPNCYDTFQNNAETDVDCGGFDCLPCDVGQHCDFDDDCESGRCDGDVCLPTLLISEVRTRGENGGSDEFVEIYNPTTTPVVLDAQWSIDARSSGAATYNPRWIGSGVHTIPGHGHFLIAGSAYSQQPEWNALLLTGVTDASSVRILYGDQVIDAVCFSFSGTTTAALQGPGFVCEGTPASNLPHNDGSSSTSNSDASIERKPGGSAGNATDVGDSSQDFQPSAPSTPQNLDSPTTP